MIRWPQKVKIWEMHYLENTPIDRIRQELVPGRKPGREDVAPSWDTVNRVVNEFPLLTPAQLGRLPAALQERWQELFPLRRDESDVDATLSGLPPGRWRRTHYLRTLLGWDEGRIGDKLGISGKEIQEDMETAQRELESPALDKGKGPLRVLIGEDLQDLAAQLKHDIEGLSIKQDYAVWQFPGNPWAFQEAEEKEFESVLDVIPHRGGARVMGLKAEKEKGGLVLVERLRQSYPEFAAFDDWKGRIAELVADCQIICREIWGEAEAATGLKMGIDIGYGHLIHIPLYVWEFALENYSTGNLPELELVPIDEYHAFLAPGERPGWVIAVGLTQAMVVCREQTSLLCERYTQDPRIGELLERETDVKKQVEPLLRALARAITPFFG